MTRTAYKYRKWDKYAKRIITHQELYFANPNTFNDLFDCEACGIIKDYNPPCPPFSINEKGEVIFYDVDPIAFLNEAMKQSIGSYGVCCFSKSYDSILMWSHYADYNRGVCFRFDLKKIKQNVGFANIKYVKKKPIYDFNNSREDESKWFIYKSHVWKYEREVRGIIAPPQKIKNKQYRKVNFPKEALKEIIFGANTKKRTCEEIIGLCKENGFQDLQFSVMKPTTNADTYKLLKVPLLIDTLGL